MSQIVAVGFRTRPVPGTAPDPATLAPPSNYKDPAVIARWREDQMVKMGEQLLLQPYTSTFDEVTLWTNGASNSWSYRDQSLPQAKQPAPLAVWAWLKTRFPSAWPHTTHPRWPNDVPPVILVGFDTRLFVDIMGVECSKPEHQPKAPDGAARSEQLAAVPLSFWQADFAQASSAHRDLSKLFTPERYRYVDWPVVLRHYGLAGDFPGWTGPRRDPVANVALALRLADAIGMLLEK